MTNTIRGRRHTNALAVTNERIVGCNLNRLPVPFHIAQVWWNILPGLSTSVMSADKGSLLGSIVKEHYYWVVLRHINWTSLGMQLASWDTRRHLIGKTCSETFICCLRVCLKIKLMLHQTCHSSLLFLGLRGCYWRWQLSVGKLVHAWLIFFNYHAHIIVKVVQLGHRWVYLSDVFRGFLSRCPNTLYTLWMIKLTL